MKSQMGAGQRAGTISSMSAERELQAKIFAVRGSRVMLDSDLAALYGVETRVLLQAVRRNRSRFPPDFMFVLSKQDLAVLRSQSVISSDGHGGRRSAPCAFTEQGVAMLSSVLRSEQAIAMNIAIMRAFVRMRELASSNKEVALKLDELERRVDRRLADQDGAILDIVRAIRELTSPANNSGKTKPRPIGFVTPADS